MRGGSVESGGRAAGRDNRRRLPALAGSQAGVFSDGNGVYRDWTLDPEDVTNWCVVATPFSHPTASMPGRTTWVLARSGALRTLASGWLYKPKARSTNIDFLTWVDGAPTSFEIRSDSDASIQLSTGTKTITYNGTFQRVRFDPGAKAKTTFPAFSMPVRMTFTMP